MNYLVEQNKKYDESIIWEFKWKKKKYIGVISRFKSYFQKLNFTNFFINVAKRQEFLQNLTKSYSGLIIYYYFILCTFISSN